MTITNIIILISACLNALTAVSSIGIKIKIKLKLKSQIKQHKKELLKKEQELFKKWKKENDNKTI